VPIDPASTTFRAEVAEGEGGKVIRLFGVIDEHADLAFLASLRGRVRLSLKGVRRINSFGVRAWIDAVRKVPAECSFELSECPPPVVDQMNMVAGFVGRGKVVSFYAAMRCEACDRELDHLFVVDDCKRAGGKLPRVDCPSCKKPMEVDDIEEQYLMFIREH
jgi:hypothetical protein